MASDDLRRQADAFVDLPDLADIIGRPARPRAAPLHPGRAGGAGARPRGGRRRLSDAEPPRDCPLCPRLAAYRRREPGASIPTGGTGLRPRSATREARLLIVGLAPGRAGANRTGRPFTGDFAGVLLYETLIKSGFARGRYGARPDDGLELVDCMITNAVRCAPPKNKPLPDEEATCRPFLAARIKRPPAAQGHRHPGRCGAAQRAEGARAQSLGRRAADTGRRRDFGGYRLINSYHCSRLNTNTGRLTPEMFEAVLSRPENARRVEPPSVGSATALSGLAVGTRTRFHKFGGQQTGARAMTALSSRPSARAHLPSPRWQFSPRSPAATAGDRPPRAQCQQPRPTRRRQGSQAESLAEPCVGLRKILPAQVPRSQRAVEGPAILVAAKTRSSSAPWFRNTCETTATRWSRPPTRPRRSPSSRRARRSTSCSPTCRCRGAWTARCSRTWSACATASPCCSPRAITPGPRRSSLADTAMLLPKPYAWTRWCSTSKRCWPSAHARR